MSSSFVEEINFLSNGHQQNSDLHLDSDSNLEPSNQDNIMDDGYDSHENDGELDDQNYECSSGGNSESDAFTDEEFENSNFEEIDENIFDTNNETNQEEYEKENLFENSKFNCCQFTMLLLSLIFFLKLNLNQVCMFEFTILHVLGLNSILFQKG